MELSPFWFGLYKIVKYVVYPLSWIILLFGVTAFLSLLPPHPRRLRWIRISSFGALIVLVTLSTPLVADLLSGTLEAWYPPPTVGPSDRYDAIVVLGGGVNEKGTLRPTVELTSYSRSRTLCGVEWFEKGVAPKLLFTGGDNVVFGFGTKEAREMKRWAQRLGVPDLVILTEEDARTTYENATGAKRLLGSASILLVTSASHLPRAAALFVKQGFQVTPAPCAYLSRDKPADRWKNIDLFDFLPNDRALQHSQDALVEGIGLVVYWLAGKI
ncbi:MAG TPA: YdcF family protein [Nitrospiraceae bacterium]|jgi:uncharacterized SAM-binding protein YcdF (DUF218 family)